MFSTLTIVTTTPFIFGIWDIEMLSDNRVHFSHRNEESTSGDTVKCKNSKISENIQYNNSFYNVTKIFVNRIKIVRAETKLVPTCRHNPINRFTCVLFYVVFSSKIVGESDKN